MRAHEETKTLDLLQSLRYYPLIREIARLAGDLKRSYSRKGTTLATTNVTIAAVALYHHLTLIADSLKHYPMKELSLYPLPPA